MPPTEQYIVSALESGDVGVRSFGPFDDRSKAEECVIALASRDGILSAKIEPKEQT